jgi:hypothetical protein
MREVAEADYNEFFKQVRDLRHDLFCPQHAWHRGLYGSCLFLCDLMLRQTTTKFFKQLRHVLGSWDCLLDDLCACILLCCLPVYVKCTRTSAAK